jgi:beta-glucosidase-like glycosyl hydrolase
MVANFGKTFIVGFEGEELTDEIASKLKTIDPAGVILFDTNLKNPQKVKKLNQDLKNLLGKDLFITIDQEGGKVQRLRNVSYELPSLLSIGIASRKSTNENSFLFSREVLINYAQALAHQLKELGFNFVYGPCADLNIEKTNPIIGSRSLGDDYRIVSEQLKVIIEELGKENILTCAKHFPGHGDSKKDSHKELPAVTRSITQELISLKPFIAAIEAGVDSIMIAHLLLEIENASTLETAFIDESDISKEELKKLRLIESSSNIAASINKELIAKELVYLLGFKGLIISDEITMKALSEYGNYTELSKKLLEAGNNLVIWNSNLDDALEACQKLNSLEQNDYKDLYNAYQKSLEKIKHYKTKVVDSTSDYFYDENYYVDLVLKSFESESKPDFKKIDIILINKHPKLEKDKIEQAFDAPVDYISRTFKHESRKNFLVILFQAEIDDLYNLEKIKMDNKVFQVSTDIHDPGSHMNIRGAGLLHYKALAKYIK